MLTNNKQNSVAAVDALSYLQKCLNRSRAVATKKKKLSKK